MVSKRGKQTYSSEFESHCVPHLYDLPPHLSKKLNKLQHEWVRVSLDAPLIQPCVTSKLKSLVNYNPSELESHWVPHLYDLPPHLSKKLSKLQHERVRVSLDAPFIRPCVTSKLKSLVNYYVNVKYQMQIILGEEIINSYTLDQEK